MSVDFRLSVVDQSPIRMEGSAADALNETVAVSYTHLTLPTNREV